MNDKTEWTIAYRAATEPVFHRVDLNLSRDDAQALAGQVQNALPPNHEVHVTPTRAAELTGRVPNEGVLKVLTRDGAHVPLVDDGRLLQALCMNPQPRQTGETRELSCPDSSRHDSRVPRTVTYRGQQHQPNEAAYPHAGTDTSISSRRSHPRPPSEA